VTSNALSRRRFLAMAGAAPFAASALASMQTRNIPVGLELYSVRDELTKDLKGTVTAVAKMGYQVVEFYSPYYQWTTDQAKDVRKLMDDLGIKCLSTHNSGAWLSGDALQKAIELNQLIGSRAIIMASPPGGTTGVAGWQNVARLLTEATARLQPLGMACGYHNHQNEWRAIDGQRPMDILAANTPKDVVLQFDVGTCVEVGEDPIAWINKNPGRIKSVHCKDWSAASKYAVAFGEGDAPWKAIFDAVEKTGGVEYYLVEQEVPGPEGSLAMAKKCMDNWKKLRST
jgi:sugar phosphate isomerase/epimerase